MTLCIATTLNSLWGWMTWVKCVHTNTESQTKRKKKVRNRVNKCAKQNENIFHTHFGRKLKCAKWKGVANYSMNNQKCIRFLFQWWNYRWARLFYALWKLCNNLSNSNDHPIDLLSNALARAFCMFQCYLNHFPGANTCNFHLHRKWCASRCFFVCFRVDKSIR